MGTWLHSLASVVAVSLVSLVGLVTLAVDERRMRRIATALVSLAVGALLGDAFIHLLPEAFGRGTATVRPSLLVLAGILLFFVIEKLLRHRDPGDHGRVPPLAWINLIGDAAHNFLDGMLIGASYLASPTIGLSTTLAVIAHEIPQELGDFGVLVHSGLSARRAIRLNLATASIAIAGALVVLALGDVVGTAFLLPAAAGGFVYIAAADLIPELQRDRSLRGLAVQVLLIAAGIGAMGLLRWLD